MSRFLTDTNKEEHQILITEVSYVIVALPLIFFPLGGVLGDVCCGRYKMVISGLVLTAGSMVAGTIASILTVKEDWSDNANVYRLVVVLVAVTFISLILGFSAFTSNVIQFGLGQLMEKPSESLGVFVHWLMWALKLGGVTVDLFYASTYCFHKNVRAWLGHSKMPLFAILLILFLIMAYCTRRHFNRDRVKYNPYKMIFKVLNFARKNKYPVGPVSAFAHCYDYRPSRLDYAKERYGGPFTTSDVEDVKAFKNVFLVLLALGPVFIIEVSTCSLFFRILSTHVGDSFSFYENTTCKFDIGTLSTFTAAILFPLYIWFIYSVLRNRPIKMFYRLMIGILLSILSVVSMLVIDLAGHVTIYTQNQTQPVCMFVQDKHFSNTLNIHWAVLIFPGLTKSFSDDVIMATILEFISAQSPHTMKGVLVGSFFAFVGVFHTIGGVSAIPFSLHQIWRDGYLGQHPPVVSCGFGYYLVCITVAMIGFILFIIAVKRYKYRRRDEEPYSQACVEEIFARRIEGYGNQYKGYEELPGTNNY